MKNYETNDYLTDDLELGLNKLSAAETSYKKIACEIERLEFELDD